eukprot:EG_transcript_48601
MEPTDSPGAESMPAALPLPPNPAGGWEPFMERGLRQYLAGLRREEAEDLRTEEELQERYLAAFFALPPDRTSGARFFQALSLFIRDSRCQRQQRRRKLLAMVQGICRASPPSPPTSTPPTTPP